MTPELKHLILLWRDKALSIEAEYAEIAPEIAKLCGDAIRRCAQDVEDLYARNQQSNPS